MSWYLANENKIIDQFASISGLGDLRRASEAYPALRDFFEEGVTTNIPLCIDQLNQLADKTHDPDVKVTAKGLAKLMRGLTLAVITQGFEYEGEDEIQDEKDDPLTRSNPAKPIKPTAPKARKKAAPKTQPRALNAPGTRSVVSKKIATRAAVPKPQPSA